MITFVVAVISTLVLPVHAAYSWDYFADNFAGDLAPLVVLFGEQVTKQFLCESTTFLDSIIFGVAPLGVITAVVSVIRVWRNASLKAFIGRAQEADGIAQAELCSSTSTGVCELWSSGGISRVFGRPRILEYVFTKTNDFYETKPTCGIHKPKTFFLRESRLPGAAWQEINPRKSTKISSEEHEEFAPHPNLSLNIGIRQFGKWWHVLFAVLGISIQLGFFAYAAWATYWARHLWEDNKPPEIWAFPIAATGTGLLVVGMTLCAMLIERTTYERRFGRTKGFNVEKDESPVMFFWLQPGGQTVGDQVFDAFSYWEKKSEYITSYQVDDSKFAKSGKRSYMFWSALVFTMIGFGYQFTGLRGLHASVTLYQLVATVIMAIIRALLRSKRLGRGANQLQDRIKDVEGHELDWNALQIESAFRGRLLTPQTTCGRLWYIVDFVSSPLTSSPISDTYSDGTCSLSSKTQNGSEIVGFYQNSRLPDGIPSYNEDFWRQICCVTSALSWIQEHEKQKKKDEAGRPNEAARILYYRTRLAYLTSDENLGPSQAWDTEIRQMATKLKEAIQAAATHIFANMSLSQNWEDVTALVWSSQCQLKDFRQHLDDDEDFTDGASSDRSSTDVASSDKTMPIHFLLARENGQWVIDQDKLEAVLGLWLWSMKSQDNFPSSCNKVIYVTDQNKKEELKAIIRLWISQTLLVREDSLVTVQSNGQLSQGSANFSGSDTLSTPLSIASWMYARQASGPANVGAPVMLSTHSTIPTLQLMAQDIFILFLDRIVHILEPLACDEQQSRIPLNETFRGLKDSNLKALADILVSTGLDSRETALATVVPAFQINGKLPSMESLARRLSSAAHASRAKGNFEEAEDLLKHMVHLVRHKEQASAIRDLGELYRFAVRLKKDSDRDFAFKGFDYLSSIGGLSDDAEDIRAFYNAVGEHFRNRAKNKATRSQESQELNPLESSDSQTIRPFGLVLISNFDREPSPERQKEFLKWAIKHNCPELIDDLRYINPNLILGDKCGDGDTPLSWAIKQGSDIETFSSLLDWRSTKSGAGAATAALLLQAVENGQQKYVDALLQSGVCPNARGSHGYALQIAISKKSYHIAEQLIKAGANANAWDSGACGLKASYYSTPLHCAIGYTGKENVRIVELLIEAGADVNAAPSYVGNALKIASDLGYNKIVELLLKAGAN